ncbi:putative mitotic checkpoint protein [Ostreococcus tauri]|uniref:Putative mitotic checkpoint protein n=1 Tax=Ostreococcus tauri TaxID=70448 RepID=A0A1Y5HZC8_OSTTA|nr:putative mitotic checkpoint protein [Ostreococcus tauri]
MSPTTTRRSGRLSARVDAETSAATDSGTQSARKRARSPAKDVAHSTARSRPRSTRRASADAGEGSASRATRALPTTSRSAAKKTEATQRNDVAHSSGDDRRMDDEMEIVRGGTAMVNAYEATNMVKSTLVAEFERRGDKLIEFEREVRALREKTERAESLLSATTAEVNALREMKSEHEKIKDRMRSEIAEERQANMLALEREIDRACEAESQAKALASDLSKLKDEHKQLRSSAERERLQEDSSDEDVADFSERAAEFECAAAEQRDEISSLKSENAEMKMKLGRIEAQCEAETTRANQAEEALRECEALVAQAEAAVLDMRKQMDEEKSGGDARDSSSEMEELRFTNKALQEELRIASREADEVKTLRRKAEFAATCEERAMAAEARALRAEASVIDTSSMQARLAKLEYLESDWVAVIDRVSGSVKVPSDLVERVIALETRLTTQAGDQGKMMSDLAEAQMNEAAATRRAAEAEEKHRKAEASSSSAVEALACAERQISVMTRELESLNKIVKSYEDEMNAAAAKKSTEKHQSKLEMERATEELEKSLAAAQKKIAALEDDVKQAEAKAEAAAASATAAPMQTPDTDEIIEALERERDDLARKLSSRDFDPKDVKVLHFKNNPVAAARQSALEKELDLLRSEVDGLRKAMSKMQDGSATSASDADATVWKSKCENLEKREQRLMTSFSRASNNFRKACHKIFGYKIEMKDENDGAVTFTLLSDYAEKPTDAFVFTYNEKTIAVSLKSNAFVEAPDIKRSVDTFVTRLNSIPALVANHTIDTFNRVDADVDIIDADVS